MLTEHGLAQRKNIWRGLIAIAAIAAAGWLGCRGSVQEPDQNTPVAPEAAALAVQAQPGDAASGAPFGGQPVITVLDDQGNVLATDNTTVVTAEIASGGGSLTGTTQATAVNGVATFVDLAVSGLVGQRRLAFNASGLAAAISTSFDLRPGAASPATSELSVSQDVLNVGEAAQVTLLVRDAEGNAHTTGGLTVAFSTSEGTSAGTFSVTVDGGDGSYTASFTGTESGTPSAIGATIGGQPVTSQLPTIQVFFNSSLAVPLTTMDGVTYLGYSGGLYPAGNEMPDEHSNAGLSFAQAIEPLDVDGNPSATGNYVMVSIGMSNASQEFCSQSSDPPCSPWTFMGQAAADPAVDDVDLVILNGARGGLSAAAWESPNQPSYDRIRDERLAPAGLSELQVQIAWVKNANPAPDVSLPEANADAYDLQRRLANTVRALKTRYPNMKLLFFSSRIYAGYATDNLNPEPYAYESGYAVKWLIQAQIDQMANGGSVVDPLAGDLNYDTTAPWIAWGPYIWAAGPDPNPDGLFWLPEDFHPDGTHPSNSGQAKVGTRLLDFFKTSPHTAGWFLK